MDRSRRHGGVMVAGTMTPPRRTRAAHSLPVLPGSVTGSIRSAEHAGDDGSGGMQDLIGRGTILVHVVGHARMAVSATASSCVRGTPEAACTAIP
ncbi:hypothetical protein JCM9533A_62580 [Catenuloplanes niger JCM 9533]